MMGDKDDLTVKIKAGNGFNFKLWRENYQIPPAITSLYRVI